MTSAAIRRALRARVLRWHFCAALFVIPYIFILSASGITYLIEPYENLLFDRDKWLVAGASGSALPIARQLDVAMREHPQKRLIGVHYLSRPDSATAFIFAEAAGHERLAVFVDPFTGAYLGSRSERYKVSWWAQRIHRSLMMGTFGHIIMETVASWTLIMIATGVYLWWPRRRRLPWRGAQGRGNARRDQVWRDLHGLIGAVAATFIGAFIVTGLPWTTVWRAGFDVVAGLTDQTAPWSSQFGVSFVSSEPWDRPPAPLESIVDLSKRQSLSGVVQISLPRFPGGAVIVRNKTARATEARHLIVDRFTGEIIAQAGWTDMPIVQKAVLTGVDLHQGTWGGWANAVLNAVIAGGLMALSVTGSVILWRRRIWRGRKVWLRAPAPRDWRPARGVVALVLIAGALLPTVGLSLLALMAADRVLALIGVAHSAVDEPATQTAEDNDRA